MLLPAKIFTLGLSMVPPGWLGSLPLTSILYRPFLSSFTRCSMPLSVLLVIFPGCGAPVGESLDAFIEGTWKTGESA